MTKAASEAATDMIMRGALSDMPEPTAGGPDQSEALIRLDKDIKARIAFLMDTRSRNLPGYSAELDSTIVNLYVVRQRILAWRKFPINDLVRHRTSWLYPFFNLLISQKKFF
jgi:hypothetical protein